jgi:nitrite reductase (NADH) large subunit
MIEKRERLLIVGNGMASVRLVESLVRTNPNQFAIIVVGAEPQAGYNRVLLSALLAKDVSLQDIELKSRDWYSNNSVELISGDAVISIDSDRKIAGLQSGSLIEFDRCVFATGSHAIRLPIPGMDKKNVIAFRDISDVEVMANAAVAGKSVAVIGGGILGIEAAYGLAKRGAKVSLIHVMDRLMERQLDQAAAALVVKALARKGVNVLLQKQTVEVTGDIDATGLSFADGTSLEADLIVCAIGIKPNTAAAATAGVEVKRGVVINDRMETSLPGIYAIGECAEHRGVAYGLVEPAYAQAETLATILNNSNVSFEGMVLATNLKVSGLPVFSAGNFMGGEKLQTIRIEDKADRSYRKLVLNGHKLVGCIMVGNADDALWYLDLIRREVDISKARYQLIHGRAFADQYLSSPEFTQAA